MQLGVIADDFTGATDIASFLVNNGMSTIQFNGTPKNKIAIEPQTNAIVISLKSRSCAANIAIEQSIEALKWLKQQGCKQFYFKYCSTFDSTSSGNIGPVTDALLSELQEPFTVISPALPINGRTVYQGYLFVMDKLLSDSGMRNHPINPMLDSNLIRLIESQATGKCALIPYSIINEGSQFIKRQLNKLKNENYRYAVMDALTEEHLIEQGKSLNDLKLITGGSGLAIGIAKNFIKDKTNLKQAQLLGKPIGNKKIILSGSCSIMTNKQVEVYKKIAPAFFVDIEQCISQLDAYCKQVTSWILNNSSQKYAPLIYATTNPTHLKTIQQKWGVEQSSKVIECFFETLVTHLEQYGYNQYIVAGGETSGVVSQTLNVDGFYIGPTITPGVPWVRAINRQISLALKSGNFGDENFFEKAQGEF